jgi:hypothetical protein
MSNLAIQVTAVAADEVTGMAFVVNRDNAEIRWRARVNWATDTAAVINAAIKAAAIAAAEASNFTIGPLDKKTMIGGAVDL